MSTDRSLTQASASGPESTFGNDGDDRRLRLGADWLILVGLAIYLTEFAAMAILGSPAYSPPGTPLNDVVAAHSDAANSAALLLGWMALALSGRILIIVGLRQAFGRRPLLDWAVAVMAVSVALEVAALSATAAAAGLLADGSGPDAVLAADRLAWSLNGAVTVTGGLAALSVGVGMLGIRALAVPRVLAVFGVLLGAVMIASGVLSGAPTTFDVGSALSLGVLVWWLWVLTVGTLLVRHGRQRT